MSLVAGHPLWFGRARVRSRSARPATPVELVQVLLAAEGRAAAAAGGLPKAAVVRDDGEASRRGIAADELLDQVVRLAPQREADLNALIILLGGYADRR